MRATNHKYKNYNGKEYLVVEFLIGSNIERAVYDLYDYKDKGILACGEFNGTWLYSDEVTVDGAYLQILGRTKDEQRRLEEEQRNEYLRREEAHKAKIPELTEYWRSEGRKILDEKYWGYWDECVPIRLGDLYHGMELRMCLDIVKPLNNGCSFEEAEKILDGQGHSGMSYGLMKAMLRDFCERGKNFVEHLHNKE